LKLKNSEFHTRKAYPNLKGNGTIRFHSSIEEKRKTIFKNFMLNLEIIPIDLFLSLRNQIYSYDDISNLEHLAKLDICVHFSKMKIDAGKIEEHIEMCMTLMRNLVYVGLYKEQEDIMDILRNDYVKLKICGITNSDEQLYLDVLGNLIVYEFFLDNFPSIYGFTSSFGIFLNKSLLYRESFDIYNMNIPSLIYPTAIRMILMREFTHLVASFVQGNFNYSSPEKLVQSDDSKLELEIFGDSISIFPAMRRGFLDPIWQKEFLDACLSIPNLHATQI